MGFDGAKIGILVTKRKIKNPMVVKNNRDLNNSQKNKNFNDQETPALKSQNHFAVNG